MARVTALWMPGKQYKIRLENWQGTICAELAGHCERFILYPNVQTREEGFANIFQHVLVLYFFLWLNSITLYVYITICLSIYLLMDIWFVSTFLLLWVMYLWTLVYSYLSVKKKKDFIYLFLAVLVLCSCAVLSLDLTSGGYSLAATCRLLIAVASLVAEHRI